MRSWLQPKIRGATLLYGLAAFYSVLTALYFAFGLYSLTALPDKNTLFGMPISPAVALRVALAVGLSLMAAAGLAAVRTSAQPSLAAAAGLGTLIVLGLNLAGYQQHHLADRISLGVMALATLPATALTIWTAIGAERNARVYSRSSAWADRMAIALWSRRLLGRSLALWLLGAAGVVTAISFMSLALNQYWRIQPRYDTAVFENIFWHTLRGRIGWESIDRVTHLGVHFTPTLAVLLPIYAVFSHPITLLVIESLALVAAALPLWWLTRRVTGSQRAAYVFALAYLMFPHTIGMNIHGFKELALWPLLGFTYLLLLEQPEVHRKPLFWIVLLLALGLKEEFGITLAAISFVHWLQARQRRFHGLVIGVCAVWFLAVTQVVMPALLGPAGHPELGKGWLFAYYYEDMLPEGGRSFFGFGANAFLHPFLTAEMLARPRVVKFLFDISVPLLFLPWFGGLHLLALVPNLFLTNLLATRTGALSTLSSYITYLVPWFYAAMYGWVRLRTRFPKAVAVGQAGLLYAILLIGVLMLSQNVRFAKPISPEQDALRAWLETRPTELRVMASRCFLPLLARRDTIRTMDPNDDLAQLDLVIVQSEQHYCTWLVDPYAQVRHAVLATGDFVEDPSPQQGIVVFRRVRPAPAARS
jgi:uncharacterized membrane protein